MRRAVLLPLPILLPVAILALTAATTSAQSTDPYMARALKVLSVAPVMDGHNDLPWRIREDSAHPRDVDA